MSSETFSLVGRLTREWWSCWLILSFQATRRLVIRYVARMQVLVAQIIIVVVVVNGSEWSARIVKRRVVPRHTHSGFRFRVICGVVRVVVSPFVLVL